MNVGIFAGSFDPIHDGHIEIAKMCIDQLGLDEVIFMVESKPRAGKKPEKIHHRMAMVDIAVKNIDNVGQFDTFTEEFDIERTLPIIESELPGDELFFIFGADTFMKMNDKQWPGLDKLTKHYLVVFERGVYSEQGISDHAKELGQAIAILPSPHPKHSSTDVRFAQDKSLWIPNNVAEYIKNNTLYNSKS